MKNQILSFLIGGFTFLCIGAGVATSTDVLTVKPAVPKWIVSKSFNDKEKASEFITTYSSKGYVFRECAGAGYESYVVVMEKY